MYRSVVERFFHRAFVDGIDQIVLTPEQRTARICRTLRNVFSGNPKKVHLVITAAIPAVILSRLTASGCPQQACKMPSACPPLPVVTIVRP